RRQRRDGWEQDARSACAERISSALLEQHASVTAHLQKEWEAASGESACEILSDAAVVVQKVTKGWEARRFVHGWLAPRHRAAVKVQASWRRWMAGVRAEKYRAAREIQRVFRGWRGRGAADEVLESVQQDRAAAVLQGFCKVISAKRERAVRWEQAVRHFAARIIQSTFRIRIAQAAAWRRHLRGVVYEAMPEYVTFGLYRHVLPFVLTIQRAFRLALAKAAAARRRAQIRSEAMPVVLQCAMRRFLARRRVAWMRSGAAAVRRRILTAQRVWKGAACRSVWRPRIAAALRKRQLLRAERDLCCAVASRQRHLQAGTTAAPAAPESEDSSVARIEGDIRKAGCVLAATAASRGAVAHHRLFSAGIRNRSRRRGHDAKQTPLAVYPYRRQANGEIAVVPCLQYEGPVLVRLSVLPQPQAYVTAHANLTVSRGGLADVLSCREGAPLPPASQPGAARLLSPQLHGRRLSRALRGRPAGGSLQFGAGHPAPSKDRCSVPGGAGGGRILPYLILSRPNALTHSVGRLPECQALALLLSTSS
ncbi:hypothetical protein DIPPA_26519, partial [Diplonema papillatum]